MAIERRVKSQREGGDSEWGRDDNDLVKRYEAPTYSQFLDNVSLTVDGRPVTIPRAVPATDAQGNELLQADGSPIPRWSTIYDAAARVFSKAELDERIPVLCHRDHLAPVGLCRVCSVVAPGIDRATGKVKKIRGLVPACMHRVEKGMDVSTRARDVESAANMDEDTKADLSEWISKIRMSTHILTQLLHAEHHRKNPDYAEMYENELEDLKNFVEAPCGDAPPPASLGLRSANENRNVQLHERSRALTPLKQLPAETDKAFAERQNYPYSSRTILVNHDNCILCDRCVRSCTDVKKFKIIGHTGKGADTRIAFDLDKIMNDSDCTQCGECASACPTEALVFRRRIAPSRWKEDPLASQNDERAKWLLIDPDFQVPLPVGKDPESYLLSAEEILELTFYGEDGVPFQPFAEIPLPYLKWNDGAVRRRPFRTGDVLGRQGEYASTAFLIRDGLVEVTLDDSKTPSSGWFGWFKRSTPAEPTEGPEMPSVVGPDGFVVGEAACFSGRPRNRTIAAVSDGLAYEVTRNLLEMMRRTGTGRRILSEVLIRRAAEICIGENRLLESLKLEGDELRDVARELLNFVEPLPEGVRIPEFEKERRKRKLVRYSAGERIVREDSPADDVYLIHEGFVRVTANVEGKDVEINVIGKYDYFGEVALLSQFPEECKKLSLENLPGRRTASVTALGDVELLRIPGEALKPVLERHPQFKELLSDLGRKRIKRAPPPPADQQLRADHTRLGLYQAQNLLVLDLERCTRCDECTKGCANSHDDGVARLLREGLRFDKYLIATSCRSCHQPYCLDGCPVDAIHRKGKSLSIVIDNHCIGCSLCERNCPYGSIQMVSNESDDEGVYTAAKARKAVNCDLCQDLVGADEDPFCVHSCPHDAAFRWKTDKLKTLLSDLTPTRETTA